MSKMEQYCPGEMLALLKWYRAMGVTIGVADDPVNRFLQPLERFQDKWTRLSGPKTRPNKDLEPSFGSTKTQEALDQADTISGPLSNSPGSRNIHPATGQSGLNCAPQTPIMPPAGGAFASSAPHAGLSPDASDATKLAAEAKNLDDLRQALEAYEGCSLKKRARKLVFEDGNRQAKIMLIGEAPGREEDLDGRPFVGRSGILLDRMLAFIGLDRSGVYIANTVPWRPPGNRTPSPLEVALCAPFLQRQIEMVAPKILITLGAAATRTMFDARLSITKVRGQWRKLELGQHQMRAMPTLHPAFLLRQPAQKRLVWLDMLAIARAMEEMGIEKSLKSLTPE